MRGNPNPLVLLALVFGLGAGCSEATGGTSGGSTGAATSAGSSGGSSSSGTSGGSSTGSSGGSATGGSTSGGGTTSGGTSGGTTGGGKAAGAPCSGDAECASTVCGVNGSGACCVARCDTSDPICGAAACDGQGLCVYRSSLFQCRAPSCAGATLTEAASCDGAGQCPAVVTTDCSPYACTGTPSTCATSCSGGNASCASGSFCDTATQTCCAGLAGGGTIAVDGATGSDAVKCCGFGTHQACQTLTHAMQLIDAAQAQNVTIVATVNGGGGDWTQAEVYPVLLGWGVELSAPGVFFLEPLSAPPAQVFDIGASSANDKVGYASIAGSAQSPVGIGMDSANTQQTDAVDTIKVEPGATLYIANASVNGSQDLPDSRNAVYVSAGATLVLGQDQSGAVTGTVTIGNALGAEATDGKTGIFCATDQVSAGCTIKDAVLVNQSSVVIQGQEHVDLVAEDFATISLTSKPVIGVPPDKAGFNRCPQKKEAINNAGVFLYGPADVTFKNGVVQCIAGAGFLLLVSPWGNSDPTLNLDNTIIQNTELGIAGFSGKAIVTNTTIQYNVVGVNQGAFGGGPNGTVDLGGGGNTVICSSSAETSQGYAYPGVDVYNNSTATLNANNVAWDTANPDYFDCDATFASCTCNNSSCATTPGSDDMDAVEDSTARGGITTKGATQAKHGCN